MEFTETMTIALPVLTQEQLDAFAEHRSPTDRGLVIEAAAIHEGMTSNFNNYPGTELAAALPSWTSPYPKPVLLHHDPLSEAVGRVIGARMDKEDDGTPYVRLQLAITESSAIQKVRDQRYLTGSVGGKAGKANCTICQADWANASMFDIPCKHRRGKEYAGKLCSIEMSDIAFKEYSFVNMPADQRSGVRAVHAPIGESFQAARFYCLDMQKESITEFGESERNVLEGLGTQAASSLYLGLKGAFLSALAEDSREDKENGMGGEVEAPPVVEEEEDVLAVAESLSDDLSTPAAEAEGDEEDEEVEDGDEDGDDDADEGGDEEPDGDEPASEPTTPEPPAETTPAPAPEPAAEPAAEEPPAEPAAADAGDATGDAGGESVAGVATTPASGDHNHGALFVGSTTTPNFVVTSGNTTYSTMGASATSNGSYTITVAPDPRVAELETQLSTLKEENGRLRGALKKGLAERVVDLKIALGSCELEEREQTLEDHMTRSASSLADSLRDLATMSPGRQDYHQIPTIQSTIAATGGKETTTSDNGTSPQPKTTDPEDLFVDALMGRRPL